jgi:Fe-S-cluster-containing hydrogenase component 2
MKKILIIAVFILSLAVTVFAVYQINPSDCRNCGRCVSACDEDAIYYDSNVGRYQINPDDCESCGDCVDRCPFGAIDVAPVANENGEVEQLSVEVNVFPNPTSTKAMFKVFTAEKGVKGSLDIYNLKGQKIKSFAVDGKNVVRSWDLTDNNGSRVSAGSYLYKLVTPEKSITKSLTVLD